MTKNQHTSGPARSPNQSNTISEDPRDGDRLTSKPETEPTSAPGTQGKDAIDAFGKRGQARSLDDLAGDEA